MLFTQQTARRRVLCEIGQYPFQFVFVHLWNLIEFDVSNLVVYRDKIRSVSRWFVAIFCTHKPVGTQDK